MKQTISATEFKAKCLDLLDQIDRGELDELAVTKRGHVVARLVPPPASTHELAAWHGFMRGAAHIAPGTDLTEPVTEAAWEAEDGLSQL